jgi:DNA-directed RNA polymerase specialized sigma24 family protein
MDKQSITAEIKIYRKTRVWSQLLYNYFNKIVEAVVSNHAPDLERSDAIQEAWLFIIKLIPKVKLKQNYSAYFYTCLRHYMSDLREQKVKGKMVSLEDIAEPEDKHART